MTYPPGSELSGDGDSFSTLDAHRAATEALAYKQSAARAQYGEQLAVVYDPTPMDIADTARASRDTLNEARDTNALLNALVQASIDQDARERRMLRWTVASVALAGVAAVASVVALFVR